MDYKIALQEMLKEENVITRVNFVKFMKKLSGVEREEVKDMLENIGGSVSVHLLGYWHYYMAIDAQPEDKLSTIQVNNDGNTSFLKIDNFQQNVEFFHEKQPFFYDKSRMFWFWNKGKFCYEIVDETDVMRMLDKRLGFFGQTVGNNIKSNYLEAFKRVGRDKMPREAHKKWIQFKDKAFSIKSGKIYDVQPNYFFTNPIPWDIGNSDETPVMDKLFTDWVGEERKKVLYELMAYCCYSDYPIQLLFCMWGNGRNGKSQYMKIMDKFIGKNNIATTELDVLTSNKFESFKLYKKLACTIGETNFGQLESSSLIKRLVGGDKIGFEKKNKDPFDDYNYAKIIIASNSLPDTKDTSDGFYRRWMIIPFEREFAESGHDIFLDIPEVEYNNLAAKVCKILPELLKRGTFTGQGTIQERKDKYISVSNPLSQFLDDSCERSDTFFVEYNKLYTAYIRYLLAKKRRRVNHREFKTALEDEGLYPVKTSKPIQKIDAQGYTYTDYRILMWIEGIQLRDVFADFAVFPKSSTSFHTQGSNIETQEKTQIEQSKEKSILINTKGILDELKNERSFEEIKKLIPWSVTDSYVETIVMKWMQDGDVYETRPGFFKTLV